MKFCLVSNVSVAVICLALECFAWVNFEGILYTEDLFTLVGQIIGLTLFGIMGVLLLVSATKIKRRMRMDSEEEKFLK